MRNGRFEVNAVAFRSFLGGALCRTAPRHRSGAQLLRLHRAGPEQLSKHRRLCGRSRSLLDAAAAPNPRAGTVVGALPIARRGRARRARGQGRRGLGKSMTSMGVSRDRQRDLEEAEL